MVNAELPLNCRLGVALVALQLLSIFLISHSMPADVNVHPNSPTSSTRGGNNQQATSDAEEAKRSFQEFISSNPDSTVIGKFERNSTNVDLLLLKKMAEAIVNIQEMEEAENDGRKFLDSNQEDCFVEMIHIERIPGKCQKVKNGQKLCQSVDYLAPSPDCSSP